MAGSRKPPADQSSPIAAAERAEPSGSDVLATLAERYFTSGANAALPQQER